MLVEQNVINIRLFSNTTLQHFSNLLGISFYLKALASAQTEVGTSDKLGSASGTSSIESINKFGLTPIRSALVEWSLNLGFITASCYTCKIK